jgi:hypothetical protein
VTCLDTYYFDHVCVHISLKLGRLRQPVRCLQPDCSSYFTKLCSLFRHVNTLLSVSDVIPNVQEARRSVDTDKQPECSLSNVETRLDCALDGNAISSAGVEDSLKHEAACLVASLRANNTPYSVITDVMQSCQHMINTALNNVRSSIVEEIPALKRSHGRMKSS